MICPFCNKENETKNKYCVHCGKEIENHESQDEVNIKEEKITYDYKEKYAKKSSIYGSISFGFGVVSCFGPISIIISILFGIIAIIYGSKSLKTTKVFQAKMGITLGILGIILGIIILTVVILFSNNEFLAMIQNDYPEFWSFLEEFF